MVKVAAVSFDDDEARPYFPLSTPQKMRLQAHFSMPLFSFVSLSIEDGEETSELEMGEGRKRSLLDENDIDEHLLSLPLSWHPNDAPRRPKELRKELSLSVLALYFAASDDAARGGGGKRDKKSSLTLPLSPPLSLLLSPLKKHRSKNASFLHFSHSL